MSPERLPVSVLILTLNEADNLPRCLEALRWCDDVVVLDSGSTDATCEIAEAWGARVMHRAFDDFASQRNHGLDVGNLHHEWVLHLDADEVLTDAFLEELAWRIRSDEFDAYRIPSKMMFMEHWLRHCTEYPVYQVRLGRRDALRFVQVGHGQRESLHHERIGTFEAPWLHYSFSKGIADWFARHNRYSSDEAVELDACRTAMGDDLRSLVRARGPLGRRRALKRVSAWLPLRGLMRFLYSYVLQQGFRDGWPGFVYCRMLAVYETMIELKMIELRKGDGGADGTRTRDPRRDRPVF